VPEANKIHKIIKKIPANCLQGFLYSKFYNFFVRNQIFYFFVEKKCVGLPRRRASVGVNQKILENLQRRQRRFEAVSKYSFNDFHRLLPLP